MDVNTLILLSMFFPLLACASNILHGEKRPNLRDGVTFLCALASFACVVSILVINGGNETEAFVLWSYRR